MNILITGGNGFLGSSLAENFLNRDYNVSLLVRSNSNLSRLQTNIDNYKIYKFWNSDNLSNILIDVNPDVIIHTACNYGRNNEFFETVFEANYRFGLSLINGVESLNKEVFFINIGTILPPQINFYSFSKNQFSELGKFISLNNQKIRFINVLLQHMYGPGDDEKKFTSYIINSCLRNESHVNLTRGEQQRDFIYIKDVTEALAVICDNLQILDNGNIEIGSGSLISIKELVLKIHKISNSKTELNFGAINSGISDIELPAADLSILKGLNWKPVYSIDDGIIETIKNSKK